MKSYLPFIYFTTSFFVLISCENANTSSELSTERGTLIFAKEPRDSASYKKVKDNFYERGDQLFERKLLLTRDSSCKCEFVVFYDSVFREFTGDTILARSLRTVVDVNSYLSIDSSEYSKDKDRVYYFHGNSDGGNRAIVINADPPSFKRLYEYRWGIDKNYVYYLGSVVEGLNVKHIQAMKSPDTSDHFVEYIRDGKNVFYQHLMVQGADVKSFKLVSDKDWEAEDKNHKYKAGRKVE